MSNLQNAKRTGRSAEAAAMADTQAIDESSLDWMPKSVWGPIKWKELHCRGLVGLPMDHEKEWFASFLRGLPCPKCRQHFEQFLRKNRPDFSSREAFFAWTVEAHNYVNRACGKRSYTVEQARKLHQFAVAPEEASAL